VAIEGDAIAFAKAWARRAGADVESAPAFGTASATVDRAGNAVRIDFSATRRETYRHPGALPDVTPSGIEDDLARRDFTVNAMAIPIAGPLVGRLLDPFGGRADIRRRRVRMLHPRSPQDDPTRAFRAARFALRLEFAVAPETRRWIGEARKAGAFDAVSGDRLRREIALLLGEQPPERAAGAMAALGLDRAIHPSLQVTPAIRRRLRVLGSDVVPKGEDRFWAALAAWLLDLPPGAAREVADRLQIAGARREELLGAAAAFRSARTLLADGAPDSEIAAAARGWSPARIATIASALSPVRRARFLAARKRGDAVRLGIGGGDLRKSGVPAGPAIGIALDRTWRARVDRRIARAEELPYALRKSRT